MFKIFWTGSLLLWAGTLMEASGNLASGNGGHGLLASPFEESATSQFEPNVYLLVGVGAIVLVCLIAGWAASRRRS